MGFFSWNCQGCDHPMLSHWATNRINDWMEDVVVIDHTGSIFKGKYDGYGRVDKVSIHNPVDGPEPCTWHLRCWENTGSPMEYVSSTYSPDQGYFFDPGTHDMKKPEELKLGWDGPRTCRYNPELTCSPDTECECLKDEGSA